MTTVKQIGEGKVSGGETLRAAYRSMKKLGPPPANRKGRKNLGTSRYEIGRVDWDRYGQPAKPGCEDPEQLIGSFYVRIDWTIGEEMHGYYLIDRDWESLLNRINAELG